MPPIKLKVRTENQWFQRAEVVKRNRKKRRKQGLFFVEDVRSINQLRRFERWQVEALLYTPDKRLSGWAQDVLSELDAAHHLELSPELMAKLSDKEDASEIMALVRIPDVTPAALPPTENPLVVLLDRPGNPGNLGSIMRSCDAFGADGLVITGHAADPFDPVAVRASAGAFFSMPLVELSERSSIEGYFKTMRVQAPGLRVVGTSVKGSVPLEEAALGGPCIVCFGSETMGLSVWLQEQCDDLVAIPMEGVSSSLNLACAASVMLHEARKARKSPA